MKHEQQKDTASEAGFSATREPGPGHQQLYNVPIWLRTMPVFGFVIFLGAFLLFQVQPVIARHILPWYGGSPSVWTTCMLFFQLGLVLGYGYAHLLVSVFRNQRKLQLGLHFVLLTLVLFTLPISPSPEMKPDSVEIEPIWGIVKLLIITVGFPYVLLSASGPLIQHWFSEVYPKRSPFRLYAVSNLGSLLALLTYPFVFEPLLTVTRQTLLWSGLFVVYALFLTLTAVVFARYGKKGNSPGTEPSGSIFSDVALDVKPKWSQTLRWIAFSACGSILLLSLTNQMCQDVAVVPFLWVVPLALYLLTFVIAFDHSRWYSRPFTIIMAMGSIGAMIFLMNHQYENESWALPWQIAVYCLVLFFTCLICHGEIVRLKPQAKYLTGFYLAISVGGAMGGIFVNLVAPRIFTGYWELHFGLGLLVILTTCQLFPLWIASWQNTDTEGNSPTWMKRSVATVAGFLWVVSGIVMVLGLKHHMTESKDAVIASSRGFFGVLRVTENRSGELNERRSLFHGGINHGRQYMHPKHRRMPTTYYHSASGVGATFEFLPERKSFSGQPIHVGVVGLGVGTVATYAKPGDKFRFYEINPQVEELARSHFTYLDDCWGDLSVVLGDGRVSMERELEKEGSQNYDIIVVDAFSGDSIPIHLLTFEAFELYTKHLKKTGVLAIHITNRHLDLSDPIRLYAQKLNMAAFRMAGESSKHGYYSDWVLVTKNHSFIVPLIESGRVSRWERTTPKPIFWTDDYSNLLKALY